MDERTLKLTADRDGYLLDGERHEGFPDRTDLAESERVKIARWASQMRPDEVSDDQMVLLERQPRPPSRGRRAARMRTDMLSSPLVRALWSTLDEQQQALVLNPDTRLGDGVRYPLTAGRLAALVEVDKQKIRRWGDNNLLPSTRDHRGHRQFGAAASVIAFALEGSKQNDREYYRDIVRSDQPLTAVRRAVGLVTYSAFASDAQAHEDELAQELQQTSESLRMVADALGQAAADARGRAVRTSKVMVRLHEVGATVRLAEPADDETLA